MSSSNKLLASLAPGQQAEMVKYVRFFGEKREQTLSAIHGDFADAVEDRLASLEPPYTMDDVKSALDHLEVVVKDGVRQDLERQVAMNVLLLTQLLDQGAEGGVELSINCSTIENEYLLAQAEKIRLEARTFAAEPKATFQKAVLQSLKEEQRDLRNRNDKLAAGQKTLQDRFNAVQQQLATVLAENKQLKTQLRDGEAQAKRAIDDVSIAKDEDAAELRRSLTATRSDLARAQEEAEAKVNSSKQFQQLKKILGDKNATIADLRDRLRRYEPDTLADEDD